MELHAKDMDMKIKDLSSIKCHKKMKDTSFSSGFIVFSL
jgi:hypothetical protein